MNIRELYIIGKGTSLTDFNFLSLWGKDIMGINDVYRKVPRLKCRYICFWDSIDTILKDKWQFDVVTVDHNRKRARELQKEHKIGGELILLKTSDKGFDKEKKQIPNINLSGIIAIYAGAIIGYNRLFLLGFDGGYSGDRARFIDDGEYKIPTSYTYEKYNSKYPKIDRVEIINVINPECPSKITKYKTINYEQLYKYLRRKEEEFKLGD